MTNEPADRLEAQIAQARQQPSFTTMLELVQAIAAFATAPRGAKGRVVPSGAEIETIRHRLFRDAYDLCFAGYALSVKAAAKALRARAKGPTVGVRLTAQGAGMVAEPTAESASPEWRATYHLAVATVLRQRENADEGRQSLQSLMACLDLSYDDLGRVFNVSGETVRRWEKGSHPIPNERKAEITLAAAALERLLKMFRLERLAEAVRRPAKLFEGKTALSYILQGRIAEVADRYEVLLRYQA